MIFEQIEKQDASDKRIKRQAGWAGIIIHHTGTLGLKDQEASSWKRFFQNVSKYLQTKDTSYASAHYVIGREGELVQLVDPDKYEAFHAGVSSFWHPIKRAWLPNWNAYAIGIELIGDGNLYAYTPMQYEILTVLCKELMKRYPSIHPLAITGHEVIAPNRKSDPGKLFDWKRFFVGLYSI